MENQKCEKIEALNVSYMNKTNTKILFKIFLFKGVI